MKTLKLCVAIIACILISDFVMSQNPTDNEKKSNLADLIIDKLDKDVKLADEQKITLKKCTIEFIDKNENAHEKTKDKEKQDAKILAYKEYVNVLDSILTLTQREQRKLKIQERENAINTKK